MRASTRRRTCVALTVALLAALPAPSAIGAGPAGSVTARGAVAQDPVGGPRLAERGVVLDPGPGAEPLPPIRAKAWVLADATTGEVLAAKNAHLALPPASTLKTLTALTLLPRLDPDDVYTARWSDVAVEGSHVGIVQGGTYTVHDLFNGMLLPSGNDAATALAHANGGVDATVDQMNAEAQRLQALDTVARNPSGLDAPGQVSSAYDLALIARAGLARDDFAAYARRISADFPGLMPKKPGKKRATFRIYTQNRLLLHGFDGAVGLKTGYTTNAGRTFVGAARRDGRTLVVALLRITDWSETAATNALDWGFANREQLAAVATLADPVDPAPAVTGEAAGASTDPAPAAAPGDLLAQGAALPDAADSDAPAAWPWWAVLVAVAAVALALLAVLRARAVARRRRRAAPARHARLPV